MRRALLLLACTATMASAAPVPKELAKVPSREGAWKLMKIDMPGGGTSTGMTHSWVLNAKDEVSFRGPQERSEEIRFRLVFDEKSKDLEFRRGTELYLGVYELEGDSLKLCINFTASGPRPKDIAAGGTAYIYCFQRVKDSK